jgi:hypothetical protein
MTKVKWAVLATLAIFWIVIILLFNSGCKSSEMAQFHSLGQPHHIVCYSGGVKIYEGDSPGNISNEEHSDGFYFESSETRKLVEVTGNCVVTQK